MKSSSHSLVCLFTLWYQYKFHDVAVEELQKISRIFPGMIPSTGTYSGLRKPTLVPLCRHLQAPQMFPSDNWLPLLLISAFTDSTQKDLVKLIGNLPVQYGGKSELWHQRLSNCVIVCHVYWWQHLNHKAAPTTSLFSCGCWTHSPSLLPYAFWDQLLIWSSERANMLMLEDASSFRDCTTGIT